jgi:hypothetical protein
MKLEGLRPVSDLVRRIGRPNGFGGVGADDQEVETTAPLFFSSAKGRLLFVA